MKAEIGPGENAVRACDTTGSQGGNSLPGGLNNTSSAFFRTQEGRGSPTGRVLIQSWWCGRVPVGELHAATPEISANRPDPVHHALPGDAGSGKSGRLKPLYLEKEITSVPFNPYRPGGESSIKLRFDRMTGGFIADRHAPILP